jgi:ABC-type transport system involved in multi-copper enzyme maturation permease subunit
MIGGYFAPMIALWRRDMMRTMRKRRTGAFLALYTAVLAVMILSSWPFEDMTPFMVQQNAESTLVFFVMLSYAWVAMVMPPYGAAAITQEHERDTIEMLIMSLVPSWGVVLGKVGAHTGLFLFVLLAAMPVMAAAAFFTVGIEMPTFMAMVGLVASTSIACVAIGVSFSTIAKSSKGAVILSYVGVAMMLGLPIVLYAGIVEFLDLDGFLGFDFEASLIYLTHYFTPIGATFFILENGIEWYDYLGVQLYLGTVSLLAFLFACWRFSRQNKRGLTFWRTKITKTKSPKKIRKVQLVAPIREGQNAWYAREILFGTLTRGRIRWGVFVGGCVVFGLIALALLAQHYWDPGYDPQLAVEAWVGVVLVALAVVVPGIGANIFTREFDGSRMDLLRGTLLTPREYVLGSIRSTIRSIVPLFMSILLTTFILAPAFVGSSQSYAVLLTGLGTAAATIVLSASVGIAAGTITRRTASALMLAYASVFAIFIGIWLGTHFIEMLLRNFYMRYYTRSGLYSWDDTPQLASLIDLCTISSPILSYFQNLDDSRRGDLASGYWWRSVALGFAYSIAFCLAAITGFRYRMLRDA